MLHTGRGYDPSALVLCTALVVMSIPWLSSRPLGCHPERSEGSIWHNAVRPPAAGRTPLDQRQEGTPWRRDRGVQRAVLCYDKAMSDVARLKAVWAYIRTHPAWAMVVLGLGYITVFSPRFSVFGAWSAATLTILGLGWVGTQSVVRLGNVLARLVVGTAFAAGMVAVVFYCIWSTSGKSSNADTVQGPPRNAHVAQLPPQAGTPKSIAPGPQRSRPNASPTKVAELDTPQTRLTDPLKSAPLPSPGSPEKSKPLPKPASGNAQDKATASRTGFSIQQSNVTGDNIANTGSGSVTVNPPQNPYAPVVTYTFPGDKRVTDQGGSDLYVGAKYDAFAKIGALRKDGKWEELASRCEEEIRDAPEWLTPYLYAGEAYKELGNRGKAIERLEHVAELGGRLPEYADATRWLKELRGKPRSGVLTQGEHPRP